MNQYTVPSGDELFNDQKRKQVAYTINASILKEFNQLMIEKKANRSEVIERLMRSVIAQEKASA